MPCSELLDLEHTIEAHDFGHHLGQDSGPPFDTLPVGYLILVDFDDAVGKPRGAAVQVDGVSKVEPRIRQVVADIEAQGPELFDHRPGDPGVPVPQDADVPGPVILAEIGAEAVDRQQQGRFAPAPKMGEDNDDILHNLLGLSEERLADLRARGIV